jgi:hypothetical protein
MIVPVISIWVSANAASSAPSRLLMKTTPPYLPFDAVSSSRISSVKAPVASVTISQVTEAISFDLNPASTLNRNINLLR